MSQAQGQQGQQNAPQPGTPEYNQMMASRYENQGQQGDPNAQSFKQPPAQRPEWFPENLWKAGKSLEENAQALAQSYAEARKAISQKGQQSQPNQQQSQPNQQQQDAQQAVKDAGLDWDALGVKLNMQGRLDDSDYEALEKIGIPRQITDQYISALKAAGEAARAKTAEYVGGEEVLNTILQRASQEMDHDEIVLFNKLLANDKTARAALDVLKARFAPANDEGAFVFGDGGSNNGLVGFGSQYEMTQAINKRNEQGARLYDVDPAYREQVRRRIALSRFGR